MCRWDTLDWPLPLPVWTISFPQLIFCASMSALHVPIGAADRACKNLLYSLCRRFTYTSSFLDLSASKDRQPGLLCWIAMASSQVTKLAYDMSAVGPGSSPVGQDYNCRHWRQSNLNSQVSVICIEKKIHTFPDRQSELINLYWHG